MTTATKIWITWTGQKIPVPLMSDDHIKSSYRRCCEILMALENINAAARRIAVADKLNINHAITNNVPGLRSTLTPINAKLFKSCFEIEAKKRKLKLPKITQSNYRESCNDRKEKKMFSRFKTKRLLETIEYERTNR